MNTGKNGLRKLFVLSLCVFGMAGCGEDKNIQSVAFDDKYQSTWKVGTIDFSALKFNVTYTNGSVESVPCNISMIQEGDIFKFYKVGEWKVRINYNATYYNIVDFVIVENEFDSSLKLKDQVFSYDGKSHGLSVDGPLPEGTNVYFPQGNNFTAASQVPYNVKCILSKDGYKTKELSGKLTITKSDYPKEILDKIEFEDAEFVYDGTEKKIEAKNVPSDCKIEYYIGQTRGNSVVNAGVYKITGKIICSNPNYYEIPNIEATLTIHKAKHQLNGVSFDDTTFTYEPGVKKSLLLTNPQNLPNNVRVIYENNVHEDAGEYDATARFEVDNNHEPIEPMTAKMTIIPKEIDLSDFTFDKVQKTIFDGNPKSFEVGGREYLKITKKYFNSDNVEIEQPVNAGTYHVKISFEISDSLRKENYRLINIPDGNGALLIQKKILDLTVLNFNTNTYSYDGQGHEFNVEREVEIDGEKIKYTVPEELVINKKYFSNGVEMTELPKEIGEYTVSFSPEFKTEAGGKQINPNNYSIIDNERKQGTLNIVKNKIDLSHIVLNDQSKYYNGSALSYDLQELPSGAIATLRYFYNEEEVQPNKVTEPGIYRVVITFALDKDHGYTDDYFEIVGAPKNTPTLLIQKQPIDLSGVVPKPVVLEYSGFKMSYDPKNITNFDKVSEYVTPVFKYIDPSGTLLPEGDLPKEKGTYRVLVSFKLKNPPYSDKYYTLINETTYGVEMIIK